MLENVSTVVVGLSGGADSVCLLHVLNLLKNDCNLNLIAAHVNHGIRGEEANADAVFSMNFAESLNVHFSLLKANCVEEAEESGETLEEAGRRIRYDFFDMHPELCSGQIQTGMEPRLFYRNWIAEFSKQEALSIEYCRSPIKGGRKPPLAE